MRVTNEFNFGFDIVSEDDITKEVQAAAEGETLKYAKEAEQLRQMVLPLLHNLAKNPEREYIKWPNRVETINKFIVQMFDVSGLKPSNDDLV